MAVPSSKAAARPGIRSVARDLEQARLAGRARPQTLKIGLDARRLLDVARLASGDRREGRIRESKTCSAQQIERARLEPPAPCRDLEILGGELEDAALALRDRHQWNVVHGWIAMDLGWPIDIGPHPAQLARGGTVRIVGHHVNDRRAQVRRADRENGLLERVVVQQVQSRICLLYT